MSNTFDKLSVLDSFIEEVNSYLPEIETNLGRLAQSPGDMAALEETHRRTHTIGGSASMMDFLGLAHVAHGMEDILLDALDGLIVLDEHALGLLQRSLGRLRQLLEGIRSGIDEEAITAEDDADYSRYRALVEGGSSTSSQPVLEETNVSHDPPSPPTAWLQNSPPENTSQQTGWLQNPPPASPPQVDWLQHSSPEQAPSVDWSQSHPAADATSQAAWLQNLQPGVGSSSSGSGWAQNPPAADTTSQTAWLQNGQSDTTSQMAWLQNSQPSVPSASPINSAFPSFDEVLASFRTPSVSPGEEVAWPEDPLVGRFDTSTSSVQKDAETPATPSSPQQFSEAEPTSLNTPSALDALMASTRRSSPTDEYGVVPPPVSASLPEQVSTPELASSSSSSLANEISYYQSVPEPASLAKTGEYESKNPMGTWAQAFADVRRDSQVIDEQAASLKQLVAQLREAMSVIEAQRSEFRGFLDGSKDALDRMEEWAGRAMGLNLRNSPDQVRRYLPLSVMWVSTSKLKKVLDLLGKITGGVELTDEQLSVTLRQLQESIQSCGEAFLQVQETPAPVFRDEPGWSSWEMQTAQDPAQIRERVTFERQGDLTAIRAQMEATLREEIRREYEAQYRPSAEVEQRIRAEVQREYEDRFRLQQQASSNDGVDRRELEARIRRELEIQVRQELLKQLGQNGSIEQQDGQASTAGSQTTLDQAAIASGTRMIPYASPPAEAPAPISQESKAPAGLGDFGDEAAEIFRMEAEEHLQTISVHVAALEKDPQNRELIQGIRRATHTLKGAAAMMGFRLIADLSHISEDLLDTIMEGAIAISPPVLSIILDTAEALDQLITGKGTPASDEGKVRALQTRYVDLLGERSSVQVQHVEEYLDLDAEADLHMAGPQMTATVADETQQEAGAGPQMPRVNPDDLTVRVRLQRLDELVNLFGELLVNRSVLEERLQRLMRLVSDVEVSSNRLRDVGQKLESRFEAATLPSGRSVQVMPGEGNQRLLPPGNKSGRSTNTPAHLAEFDELELDRYTEFHQLARGLSEGISDMTTLSTEMDSLIRECEGVFARENRLNTLFQDRLMKTRLVPLSQLTPRLYRAARAVGLKQGKEFEFVRDGEATEVDRTVFEEISAPLLHLVRNAVNHALETPDVRVKKGKPAVGQIKFSAAYEGNQIVIAVSDDGRGLDREHIRQTAIARGLIRPDHHLAEGDYVSLIFHPGFSTAEVLSEESGRGVGLDVVRDTVSRLRGTIVVESTPDQGTTFTMTFPTSLAIQRAMMVKTGGQQFAIPTVHVESIGRFDNFKHVSVAGRPAVLVRNDPYPLQMLAQYLTLPNTGMIEEKAQLILVNAGGHRIALVVDEIKGQSDIVMKNLGPHLRQVHGIAGATVLGNGLVVLVLELNTLLSGRPKGPVTVRSTATSTSIPSIPVRRESVTPAPTPSTPASAPAAPMKQHVDMAPTARPVAANVRPPVAMPQPMAERGKHILVVDDSPSVRRVVSNMLKQHGWEVQMARDGVEALEMISYETPAAVLLDIEMPRMDGYELISTVRAQEQYRTLPLIVLTSRAASKHQQRATLLGASAYVIKPYQDEELLNTINNLVYGTAVR